MEQMPGGGDKHILPGEMTQVLAHTLSNRFAVAQSVTQRLRNKFAKVGIEEVMDDLDVLASAIHGCSETIGRMQALWRGDIATGERPGEDSLTPTQEDARRSAAPSERKTCSGRVLYVEDDGQVRSYNESILKQAGWLVTTIGGISDAIDMLYKGTFDVVLTDLRLRSGSGLTLAAHAGQQPPKVPVGILTGWGITEDLPKNVRFVLQKPVSYGVLLEALAEAVQIGRDAE